MKAPTWNPIWINLKPGVLLFFFLFESLWEEGLESQKRKKPLIFSLLCQILSSGFGVDCLWDRSQTSPQTSLSSPGESV